MIGRTSQTFPVIDPWDAAASMRAAITIMMRVMRIDQQYDGGGFVVILKSNSGKTQYSPVNVNLEKCVGYLTRTTFTPKLACMWRSFKRW